MHALAKSMRRTPEGVLIETTLGTVQLLRRKQGIDARYLAGPLVNGSAAAFARRIADEALQIARQADLPWVIGPEGDIRITNPLLYYEQSFQPGTQALETLLRWSGSPPRILPEPKP